MNPSKREISLFLIILLALSEALTVLPAANGLTWGTDTPLVTDSHTDLSPHIMQTSDGKLWVLWGSNRNGTQVFYKTYFSGWTSDKQLTTQLSTNEAPSAAQSTNGTIWVAWDSTRDGGKEVYYRTSSNMGLSWRADTRLTFSNCQCLSIKPSVASLTDGRIIIAWENITISGGLESAVKVYYSIYNGAWSTPAVVTLDPSKNRAPDIRQAADGSVWVFWNSDRLQSQNEIFYRKGTPGPSGIAWTILDTRLTRDNGEDVNSSMSQASDGTIYVFWDSDRDGTTLDPDQNIFYATSTNNGGSWSAETRLTTDIDQDFEPSVLVDQAGIVWVVWVSTRPGTGPIDIWYRTAPQITTHDIAVLSANPDRTIVYQGYNVNVTVTVQNQGDMGEGFAVAAYLNSSLIGNLTVYVLPGQSKQVLIPWASASSAIGKYVISAHLTTISGEIDLADNQLTGGSFQLRRVGDVDGNGVVNLDDVLLAAVAWGGTFNPGADINGDHAITVDDVLLVVVHWGT